MVTMLPKVKVKSVNKLLIAFHYNIKNRANFFKRFARLFFLYFFYIKLQNFGNQRFTMVCKFSYFGYWVSYSQIKSCFFVESKILFCLNRQYQKRTIYQIWCWVQQKLFRHYQFFYHITLCRLQRDEINPCRQMV